MASYALYLVPRVDSLRATLDEMPSVARHVQAVVDKQNWGGQLHMTLTSFAGRRGIAPESRARRYKMHKDSLRQTAQAVARRVAEHLEHEQQRKQQRGAQQRQLHVTPSFTIPTEAWTGVAKGSIVMYFVSAEQPPTALRLILETINSFDLYGAKSCAERLHVTFLADAAGDAADVVLFLSKLKWDVAVAEIPNDDSWGRTLVVRERFPIGP